MKKICVAIVLFLMAASSCKKDAVNAARQAATDEGLIKAYITANNINATRDSSGLYYQVLQPGTGNFPSAVAKVTVDYKGNLLNGYVFAPASSLTASLSSLIRGWQIGIPKINKGGRILLIIPSALGYGSNSPSGSNIPDNSVLVFTIDLLSFGN